MATAAEAFQAHAAAVVRDYYVEPRIGASRTRALSLSLSFSLSLSLCLFLLHCKQRRASCSLLSLHPREWQLIDGSVCQIIVRFRA